MRKNAVWALLCWITLGTVGFAATATPPTRAAVAKSKAPKRAVVLIPFSGTFSYDPYAMHYTEVSRNESVIYDFVRTFKAPLTDGEKHLIAAELAKRGEEFSVDPKLVASIIAVESQYNPRARSRYGAGGLGQLMAGTARALGISDRFDIVQNIQATTAYVRMQLQQFQGRDHQVGYSLASYLMGPAAASRRKAFEPRVHAYIGDVLDHYQTLLAHYDTYIAPPPMVYVTPEIPTPQPLLEVSTN